MTDRAGFSIVAQENQGRGIIAERAMYWKAGGYTQRSGATAVVGIPVPSDQWFLPEGAVAGASGFESFILLGNPNDVAANIQVEFCLSDGSVITAGDVTTIQAGQRVTVKANYYLPADQGTQSFSTIVTSDQPIVAERAMYWSSNGVNRIEGHANGGIAR